MRCHDFQKCLDEMLVADSGVALPIEAADHAASCAKCAKDHERAIQAFASLQLSHRLYASEALKERVMDTIRRMELSGPPAIEMRRRGIVWKAAWAAAAVALILALGALYRTWVPGKSGTSKSDAFGLLAQAAAAEEELFTGQGITHIVNEILVRAVADRELTETRWVPLISLDGQGKARFHMLKLPAGPSGGEYTVEDEAWHDAATGRFARTLRAQGAVIFAASFDGKAVYTLEADASGALRPRPEIVSKDFHPPASPAEFLGIAAGFTSTIKEKSPDEVTDAGEVTLRDGSTARVLKAAIPAMKSSDNYMLLRVRDSDHVVAEIEFVVSGQSLYLMRRVRTEVAQSPGVAWDMSGLETGTAPASAPTQASVLKDMIKMDISVSQMAENAGTQLYLFKTDPAWTMKRSIVAINMPGTKMHMVAYRAKDGRHVVLAQGKLYDQIGPMQVKKATLAYDAPNGFKVWLSSHSKQSAEILLSSARAVITDPPSEDRTSYILESPAHTYPILALNKPLSESELHSLIDGLAPILEKEAN